MSLSERLQAAQAMQARQRPATEPGSPAAASLHVARTVCRRAERSVVALGPDAIESELLVYLNRLSDLLFVMARAANHQDGVAESEW